MGTHHRGTWCGGIGNGTETWHGHGDGLGTPGASCGIFVKHVAGAGDGNGENRHGDVNGEQQQQHSSTGRAAGTRHGQQHTSARAREHTVGQEAEQELRRGGSRRGATSGTGAAGRDGAGRREAAKARPQARGSRRWGGRRREAGRGEGERRKSGRGGGGRAGGEVWRRRPGGESRRRSRDGAGAARWRWKPRGRTTARGRREARWGTTVGRRGGDGEATMREAEQRLGPVRRRVARGEEQGEAGGGEPARGSWGW